jgi:hypothetical protein
MARKSQSSDDSLDMLLDTMCNAFGGIVIIAILVALLMRETGKTPVPGDAQSQAVAALQLPGTEAQLKVEQALLEKLKNEVQAHGVLAKLVQKLNDLVTQRQQIIAALKNVDSKGKEAEAKVRGIIGTLENEIADKGKKRGEMKAQSAAISKEVLDLKALIEQLRVELKKWGGQENSRVTKRPPREQQSARPSFNFVIRFGELFPVQEYKNGQIPLSSTYIDWNGDEARLKKGSGLKIDTHKTEILSLLNSLPSGPMGVDVVSYVYSDSFEAFIAFQKLRQAQSSLEGGWEPVTGEGNISFSNSGTRPANQP